MSDAEQMVRRAEQLERLAEEMFSPEHKRQLLQLAKEWREIAARVSRAHGPELLKSGDGKRPN